MISYGTIQCAYEENGERCSETFSKNAPTHKYCKVHAQIMAKLRTRESNARRYEDRKSRENAPEQWYGKTVDTYDVKCPACSKIFQLRGKKPKVMPREFCEDHKYLRNKGYSDARDYARG